MHHLGFWKVLFGVLTLVVGSAFAAIDFKGTVTLGSILIGILVIAVAGIFAVRNQQARSAMDAAKTWREEAEARSARADRLDEELREQGAAFIAFEREQQEIRHSLKNEVAGLKSQLKVEEAKHDLSALLERMQAFHAEAMTAMQSSTGSAVEAVAGAISEIGVKLDANQTLLLAGQEEQKSLLIEIRDALRTD